MLDPLYVKQANAGGGILNPTVVVGELVVGTWKRTLEKGSVVVKSRWFSSPKPSDCRALAVAADKYGTFLGLRAIVA